MKLNEELKSEIYYKAFHSSKVYSQTIFKMNSIWDVA